MDQRIPYYCSIAIFCLSLVLATGCTQPGGSVTPTPTVTPAPTPGPGELWKFGESDGGGIYTIPLDTEFTLRLAENPTTGFSWNISLTEGLVLIDTSYEPNSTAVLGSGGIRTWHMQAVMPGMQAISGTYARPWESTMAANYYNLTLLVHGPCGNETCPPSTMPPRYHVYTEGDNGKDVNETLGDEFNVRLAENPSTGYTWNFSISDGLQIVKDEFIPSGQDGTLVGAGGVRSVHIRTVMAGVQQVNAEYRRPWVTAGTVTFVDLEGGFFGIVADDGTRYLPLNLDETYRHDRLRVAFSSEIVKDAATIQQWGTAVNLTSIEEITGFALMVSVS
jgi:inhibitor of cysteine peptidase